MQTSGVRSTLQRFSLSQREFFERVFLLMGFGLVITALVSYGLMANESLASSLFTRTATLNEAGETVKGFSASGYWWTATLVQFGMVLLISHRGLGKGMSLSVGVPLFVFYAALNGVTMAPALMAYTTTSIVKVFFITATGFFGCALWGMTTKRDLTSLGVFFLYGLVGLLAVMVVNLFMQSPMMDFAVSGTAVLLFAALTAFDIQMLRKMYDEGADEHGLVVYGALALYLDFVNMFLHLLRLIGVRIPGQGD